MLKDTVTFFFYFTEKAFLFSLSGYVHSTQHVTTSYCKSRGLANSKPALLPQLYCRTFSSFMPCMSCSVIIVCRTTKKVYFSFHITVIHFLMDSWVTPNDGYLSLVSGSRLSLTSSAQVLSKYTRTIFRTEAIDMGKSVK